VTHVIDTLLSDSSVTLDRHRLARQTREVLFARHCLIPGERDIKDWVRRAIHLVELQDRRYLDEVVPAKVPDHWLNQLMSISVFSVVYFNRNVANWSAAQQTWQLGLGGAPARRTQFFIDY
jgi:hypothetical protein